jgi:hypothetical protein
LWPARNSSSRTERNPAASNRDKLDIDARAAVDLADRLEPGGAETLIPPPEKRRYDMARRRYRRRRDFAQLELPLESNPSARTGAKPPSQSIKDPIFAQVWFNNATLAEVAAEVERTSALERQIVTVTYHTRPQDPKWVLTAIRARRHNGPHPWAGVALNSGSPMETRAETDKRSDFLNTWVPTNTAKSNAH